MEIVFASKNKGKLREFQEKLSHFGIKVISIDQVKRLKEPPETGNTFLENAYQKAVYYAKAIGKPVISEDSGLEVEALGGLPGVRSSRFAGENATDDMNNQKLIDELKKRGLFESPARYVSFIVLAFPEGMGLWSEGEVKGKVITEPRGNKGFGYDPLFVPEGYLKTMAELSLDEKNKISHRGKAIEKLVKLIKEMKNW
ncbi:RdgB/HAM1 family non-canonical purine NTP pyrophosphatase [Desulfurobacterium thermolithotrophum]|uniref:RdgB/HAM1 family non-canonical purine NTP pyrophosphatase n=1 Tax=Desulfurobacterium thermolithotrophum TaxID=64160 RepID=UPI0013D1DE54|nr:RdgB/HAM1 family non-canonical purine NTP pyrophosphatase [Desulfurobacterium thermolithotrophum]